MNAWLASVAALCAAPLFVLVAPRLVALVPVVREPQADRRSMLRLPRGLQRWSVPIAFALLALAGCGVLSLLARSWAPMRLALSGPFCEVLYFGPEVWPRAMLHAAIVLSLILLYPIRPGLLSALVCAAAVGWWFVVGLAIAGMGC